MKYQNQTVGAFKAIGIATRTSNALEMSGKGKIGALWNRFLSEAVAAKIPKKKDGDIVAIYYDYESDADGPYSLLIGARVDSTTPVPEGMSVVEIPKQNYAVFSSEPGEIPSIVFQTWKRIWTLCERSELVRKFSTDYEVYGSKAANPKSAQIDIFIAVD